MVEELAGTGGPWEMDDDGPWVKDDDGPWEIAAERSRWQMSGGRRGRGSEGGEETVSQPAFEAIVRGYKAEQADPGLAAVIVEEEPGTAIPQAGCLRKLEAARRQAGGLGVSRAVACITDRWQALEVGTDWRDLWVVVGVDAGGGATFERIDKEESY